MRGRMLKYIPYIRNREIAFRPRRRARRGRRPALSMQRVGTGVHYPWKNKLKGIALCARSCAVEAWCSAFNTHHARRPPLLFLPPYPFSLCTPQQDPSSKVYLRLALILIPFQPRSPFSISVRLFLLLSSPVPLSSVYLCPYMSHLMIYPLRAINHSDQFPRCAPMKRIDRVYTRRSDPFPSPASSLFFSYAE